MTRLSISTNLVVFALSFIPHAFAVGTPFGAAAGTTGGGSAKPATPSSISELTSWLSDSTARVIVLDKMYDFTSSEGTTTSKGCKPWTCSPSPQLAIDGANSWCSREQPKAATTTITYNKAGIIPLKVGNNKTLLGKGNNAGIKGKGLKITNGNNIIIQNINIVEINPQFVWGGDALQIDGGTKIWIDHNYFQHIGRQMIATGYGAVTATTISNNVFNGESTYSAVCNGQHYWTALLTGKGDQITFALNHLYKTSGRGPHVGGTSNYYQNIHIYNNYFDQIDGHAVDPEVGSKVLVEGNYFKSVKQPILAGQGQAFAPTTSSQANSCKATLGRVCQANTVANSGSLVGTDTGTLSGFTGSRFKGASVMTSQQAADYVQSNAGVGIVN